MQVARSDIFSNQTTFKEKGKLFLKYFTTLNITHISSGPETKKKTIFYACMVDH